MSLRDGQLSLAFLRGPALELAQKVVVDLEKTARDRDKLGGTALTERQLLRHSGLLKLGLDVEWGGTGAPWSTLFDLVRLLSRVDSSLGHLVGFHFLMLTTVELFGTRAQWQLLAATTARQDWFWGNALNPLDRRTTIRREQDHYVLNGLKSFSSGSVDADYLIVSALDVDNDTLRVLTLPGTSPGLVARGDWENIGQRQTDSGTVEFRDVRVGPENLLLAPGPLGSPRASLRPLVAQLSIANVYLGLAEGAYQEAKRQGNPEGHAWFRAGVERAGDDPYILRRYGEFLVALESARLLANHAAQKLDSALEQGDELSVEERGDVALAVATTKVATTRTALQLTSEIFEVLGARSTQTRLGLDRFWRNTRTHTLHDPVDYKLRELGEFALKTTLPEPSFYS